VSGVCTVALTIFAGSADSGSADADGSKRSIWTVPSMWRMDSYSFLRC